jgi:sulfane dehydrogenase subunit SoxC
VGISLEELQLATRNHGMPLEALRWPITPLGLHYLLVHYDIPQVDPAVWRLELGGTVSRPLSLSLDDLRSRPAVDLVATMECAGNGRARLSPRPVSQPWLHEAVGTMTWTGTPLAAVLADAAPLEGAVDVVFTGADHGIEKGVEQDYQRSLSVDHASDPEVLLVWACNGVDLPPQHGYPLRLLVPGWYGMASVKWLRSISAIAEPFDGVQQATLYRYRSTEDDPGTPVTRKRPRALMAPPGIPEFLSRLRHAPAGEIELTGRAWSGDGPVARVEVSADGGSTWADARLDRPLGRHAWIGWSYVWEPAGPGDYELCVRATSASGETQPLDPRGAWNLGGYGVNAVQRVAVRVT